MTTSQPDKPRAVFSTMDLELIRQLILERLNDSQTPLDDEQAGRMGALYHRIGRIL